MNDIADSTDTEVPALLRNAPSSVEFKKLRKRLLRQSREAIGDFGMLPEGASHENRPKWLVCLSGGKDSYTLLSVLIELKWRGLLPVELLACNLDQGQPGFPATVLPQFLEKMGVPHRIEYQDTYSIVVDKVPQGRTYCALCSRLRRGNLYRIAREEGCSAVVLGHHRDDIMETLFLNMFYGGKIKAMPPKLKSDDGKHVVIRPLAYCREKDIIKFSDLKEFPIIPCNLCGSQENLQRKVIKEMLQGWDRQTPGRLETLFSAMQNIVPSHMADTSLFDFKSLTQDAEDDTLEDPPTAIDPRLIDQEEETNKLSVVNIHS